MALCKGFCCHFLMEHLHWNVEKKVNHFKGEFMGCFTQGNKALDNLLSHWKFYKKRAKSAVWGEETIGNSPCRARWQTVRVPLCHRVTASPKASFFCRSGTSFPSLPSGGPS